MMRQRAQQNESKSTGNFNLCLTALKNESVADTASVQASVKGES